MTSSEDEEEAFQGWMSVEEAMADCDRDTGWWTTPGLNGRTVEVKQHNPSGPSDKPIYRFENGDQYLGEWKSGKFHGFGAFYNAYPEKMEGLVYVGEWKTGACHGKGRSSWLIDSDTWTNNYLPKSPIRQIVSAPDQWMKKISRPFIYEGNFANDMRDTGNGTAKVMLKDGTVRVGPWKERKPVGDWFYDHEKPAAIKTESESESENDDEREEEEAADTNDSPNGNYFSTGNQISSKRKRTQTNAYVPPDFRLGQNQHGNEAPPNGDSPQTRDVRTQHSSNGRPLSTTTARTATRPSSMHSSRGGSKRNGRRSCTSAGTNVGEIPSATTTNTTTTTASSSVAAGAAVAPVAGTTSGHASSSTLSSSSSISLVANTSAANVSSIFEIQSLQGGGTNAAASDDEEQRINEIVTFLSTEVFTGNPLPTTMKTYAQYFVQEGLESVDQLKTYLSTDYIEKCTVMKPFHKKIMLKKWNDEHWGSSGLA